MFLDFGAMALGTGNYRAQALPAGAFCTRDYLEKAMRDKQQQLGAVSRRQVAEAVQPSFPGSIAGSGIKELF